MSSVNKKVKFNETTHEGGKAKKLTPIEQLRRSVLGCLLWENAYYEDGVSIADRISSLVEQVDDSVVEQLAIEAKNNMKLRHIPLFLITQLFAKNKKLGKSYNASNIIPKIVNRVDDMGELLALYKLNTENKKFARSLLRGIAKCFSKFNEYQFGKYKGKGKLFSLVDVINLTHPKPSNDYQRTLFSKIVKDTLETPNTWEVLYSLCKTTEEKKQVWEKLISKKDLGGLATLRNLRNMQDVGVEDDLIKQAIDNIGDPKLLPINFLKTAEINPKYEEQLEEKFISLFSNKEKIKGKTLLLIDISGSMRGTNEERAGSLAMIARELCEDIEIKLFGSTQRYRYDYNKITRECVFKISSRRGFALKDLCKARNEETELGNAIAICNRFSDEFDRLIVLTDEQTSDSVPNPIFDKSYMINVSTNKNGVGYRGSWTTHIDGWSDTVFNYILETEKLNA